MLKNIIYYTAIVIISFWLMLMYEGVIPEGIFAVVIFMPIVLSAIKYITRMRIKCRWGTDTLEVTAGRAIKVTANVYNDFFVPINRIEMKYEISDIAGNKQYFTVITNLKPFDERKCTVELCHNYSGQVFIRLQSVKIYDFLGLTFTTKKIGSLLSVAVLPKTEELAVRKENIEELGADEGDKHSDILPGTDNTEIFDMSPYRQGDNIRDIHWKLSLKTDSYVIKRYSMPVYSETNIYIDFAVPDNKIPVKEGIDRFYRYAFSLIECLRSMEEKINIYVFDTEGNPVKINGKSSIILWGRQCRYAEEVIHRFRENIGKGRNILISSRINRDNGEELNEYYTKLESGPLKDTDLMLNGTNVIGVDICEGEKQEKQFTDIGQELYINNDDEDIAIYTQIFKILIVFLGSYVPMAVLLDTVVMDIFPEMVIKAAVFTTAAMTVSALIKKLRYKFIYILGIIGVVSLYIGIGNIIKGGAALIKAFGNSMYIEGNVTAYVFFGLTDDGGYEIMSFISFVTAVIAIVLFIFTWKSITVLIHLLLTVPFIMLCFAYGCVPSLMDTIMYITYLFIIFTYSATYSNIVKNEKNVLKKSFYESTLNIGAICGYIVGTIVCVVMLLDIVKGYSRPAILSKVKEEVNAFVEEINGYRQKNRTDSAVGGMSRGRLGEVDRITFDGETRLVVSVTGNVEFPIYLKSYVGSEYTGNTWKEVADYKSEYMEERLQQYGATLNNIYNLAFETAQLQATGSHEITVEEIKSAGISIRSLDNMYYIPYGAYFDKKNIVKDGVINPPAESTEAYYFYQITRADNIDKNIVREFFREEEVYGELCRWAYVSETYYPDILSGFYNEIPWVYYNDAGEAVELWEHGTEINGYEPYIESVRKYLRENYEYSTEPGKLEEGQDFFTKFFEERKGYCSHFATMAVIMFRMYGIPARYVEGYYVHPSSEEIEEYKNRGTVVIEVDDRRAHAWAEIYVDGYGWMPVEVTPGYESLNYHFIDESLIEEPTGGQDNNNNNNNSRPTKEPETTAVNEETAPETEQTEKQEQGVEKKTDIRGLIRNLSIGAAVIVVSLIFGRKSYRDKKLENIIQGSDCSLAAQAWEKELIRAMELSGVNISLNVQRERLAFLLSCYIEENAGKNTEYNPKEFEKKLLKMYNIFDKASYDNKMITAKELEEAEKTAQAAVKYIYDANGVFRKFFMKYIKCLYLGQK
ncbi:MAG: transglutaminase domain-containing protein [Lachnospiraceae bacterium]